MPPGDGMFRFPKNWRLLSLSLFLQVGSPAGQRFPAPAYPGHRPGERNIGLRTQHWGVCTIVV